jgi:hypothetical protein
MNPKHFKPFTDAGWLVVVSFLFISFINPQLNSASLKSLFIYNFTKHIDWPDNSDAHISIGIVNEPEFSEKLQQILKNKKIKDKTYEVLSIHSPEEAQKCQLVFIPAEQGYQLKQFVKWLDGRNVLIVTEGNNMAAKGAAISIVEYNGKLSFEVNEQAIYKSGLNVSKELIRLGTPVK